MTVYNVLGPKTEREGYGIIIITERRINDISFNYPAVKELCDRCNTLDVDPVHFDILLEEFLSRREDF